MWLLVAGAWAAPQFTAWSSGHQVSPRQAATGRRRVPAQPTRRYQSAINYAPAAPQSTFRLAVPALATGGFNQEEATTFLAGFNRKSKNILDRDVVEKTRQAADNAKALLTSLKNNQTYASLVVKALESSNCLDNIDDAIAAVEVSARLVEEVAPAFQSLQGQTDILLLTRGAAVMLRKLESLQSQVTAASLDKDCKGPATGGVTDLDSFLSQFASFVPTSKLTPNINISALITATNNFLAKVKQSTARLQDGQLCARGDFQETIFSTIEEIMTDLSVLMRSLNAEQSSRLVSPAQFQQQFQQMFQQVAAGLNTAGLQQPCSAFSVTTDTTYAGLANTLDDLAAIIEDVGVETLAAELGLDLDFDFNNIDFNLNFQ